MNAKQARALAKEQVKIIEGDERITLHDIFTLITDAIKKDPTAKEIYIPRPSKRIEASLQSHGYETREWRGRDGDLFLIVNWSEDGIQNIPGANDADAYYTK